MNLQTNQQLPLNTPALPEVKSILEAWHRHRLKSYRDSGYSVTSYRPWLSVDTEKERIHQLYQVDDSSRVQVDNEFVKGLEAAYGNGAPNKPLENLIGNANPETYIPLSEMTSEQYEYLEDALELVSKFRFGNLFDEIVLKVIPLDPNYPSRPTGAGFSNLGAVGAVFTSIPNTGKQTAIEWAINLSHELGHNYLNVLNIIDPIISAEQKKPIYSGLKETERPPLKSFHALVALYFICTAIEDLEKLTKNQNDKEHLKDRRSFYTIAYRDSVYSHLDCKFTMLGEKLFREIRRHFMGFYND